MTLGFFQAPLKRNVLPIVSTHCPFNKTHHTTSNSLQKYCWTHHCKTNVWLNSSICQLYPEPAHQSHGKRGTVQIQSKTRLPTETCSEQRDSPEGRWEGRSKAWLPVPEKILPPFASETNPLFDEKSQLPIFLNIKIVLKTYPFVFLINPFDKEKIMSQILTFLKHCLCLNFLAIQVPSFSANIFFLARNF